MIESMIKSSTAIAQQQQKKQDENAVERRVQDEMKFPLLTTISIEDLLVR